ncbi:MAG: DUF4177 domain-containing protein [Pseudomonadota bacterium]|nr:DUF4177 domain-containing protein [Pseudomonadota bacterium]
MKRYEYNVVPAPKKGKRAKGVKGAEARFAHALAECMNEMAADGWEYLRTDTLPSEERSGITGRATVFQNMLVFRREVTGHTAGIGRSLDEMGGDAIPRLPSATEANTVAEAAESAALTDKSDDAAPAKAEDETSSDTKATDDKDKTPPVTAA